MTKKGRQFLEEKILWHHQLPHCTGWNQS